MTAPGAWRPPNRLAPQTRTGQLVRLGLFALSVSGALIGLGVLWIHLNDDPLADVRAYYDAAVRLNHGGPLYPSGASPDLAEFYRYPPLLAVVLRPFALLPYPAFAALWEVGIVAVFLATLRRLRPGPGTWLAVGILAAPLGWALAIGQAQVVVTWLLAIGSPWAVAVAGNLKLFPALAALYWLGRGQRSRFATFLGWSLALAIAQVVLEPSGSRAFLGIVNLDQVGHVRNVSPYALSPEAWAVLVAIGVLVTYRLARTRWGWPAAVALATLSTPRLLIYMFGTLLAAFRRAEPAESDGPDDVDGGAASAVR